MSNRKALLEQQALSRAKADGSLEPIFRYLESEIGLASKPEKPNGAEWPYKRAYRDGRMSLAEDLIQFINGRTSYSPDVAQNTED